MFLSFCHPCKEISYIATRYLAIHWVLFQIRYSAAILLLLLPVLESLNSVLLVIIHAFQTDILLATIAY